MSETDPLWGAARIHGELLKLGVDSWVTGSCEDRQHDGHYSGNMLL